MARRYAAIGITMCCMLSFVMYASRQTPCLPDAGGWEENVRHEYFTDWTPMNASTNGEATLDVNDDWVRTETGVSFSVEKWVEKSRHMWENNNRVPRFLVCKTRFGLGNQEIASLNCGILAMVTGRALLLPHWNSRTFRAAGNYEDLFEPAMPVTGNPPPLSGDVPKKSVTYNAQNFHKLVAQMSCGEDKLVKDFHLDAPIVTVEMGWHWAVFLYLNPTLRPPLLRELGWRPFQAMNRVLFQPKQDILVAVSEIYAQPSLANSPAVLGVHVRQGRGSNDYYFTHDLANTVRIATDCIKKVEADVVAALPPHKTGGGANVSKLGIFLATDTPVVLEKLQASFGPRLVGATRPVDRVPDSSDAKGALIDQIAVGAADVVIGTRYSSWTMFAMARYLPRLGYLMSRHRGLECVELLNSNIHLFNPDLKPDPAHLWNSRSGRGPLTVKMIHELAPCVSESAARYVLGRFTESF